MALILSTATDDERREAVRQAAERLRDGQVVALPTETVYGLAANAFDAQAVARIYAVKGRPAENPLIVHVADLEMARRCVAAWPETAARLARSFWPGPLTLVLPRADTIADIVTAGGSTVAIRSPAHAVMQDVIRACGFPLAAPSANPSNAVSPTTAMHVQRMLGDRLDLIVDGGPSAIGIESTVVDLVAEPPRVLRPGSIHAPAIVAALAVPMVADGASSGPRAATVSTESSAVARSPGQLGRHYSPRARLVVADWHDDASFESLIARLRVPPHDIYVLSHRVTPGRQGLAGVAAMPHDAAAYGRALYAELHRADESGAGVLVVERLPEGPEWQALNDRLTRAAAP